jgi:ethanolamine utilization microcompartment shell protein EutL
VYIGGITEEVTIEVGNAIESIIDARPRGIPYTANFGIVCSDLDGLAWKPPGGSSEDLDVMIYVIGRDPEPVKSVCEAFKRGVEQLKGDARIGLVPCYDAPEEAFEEFDELVRWRSAS